jgi:hypothetical protein
MISIATPRRKKLSICALRTNYFDDEERINERSGAALGMPINSIVTQFEVAQALLPVRFLQSAHRQECLCYQKQDKDCPPKKRAALKVNLFSGQPS